MNGHGKPLSVIENEIETLERMVNGLVDLAQKQTSINSNLEKTIALLQQQHNDFEERFNRELDRYEQDTVPKVVKMWDEHSKLRGVLIFVCTLGGFVVGCATVGVILMEHIAIR